MQACRIAATEVACRRGDRVLFRGLSLELGPGEACQLAGANGIGKSSLIRIVAGLLRPFAGEVQVEGAVGMVDERLALEPQLPLGRALAFWQRLDEAPPGIAERLEIDRLSDVPVRYLSTGQKKRAALARLLGQQAPVWLLDEPLNGLDTQAVKLTQELAAEHCRSGGLCLIASHQPFEIAGMRQVQLADYAP